MRLKGEDSIDTGDAETALCLSFMVILHYTDCREQRNVLAINICWWQHHSQYTLTVSSMTERHSIIAPQLQIRMFSLQFLLMLFTEPYDPALLQS